MDKGRLTQIEFLLQSLREQKFASEKESIFIGALDKTKAEQRLKSEIIPRIKELQQEYWQILSQPGFIEFSDQEANVVLAEVVKECNSIELKESVYPSEELTLLTEIRDKLNQNDKTAAAKLKGIISSIPPFIGVSYEAEIDTENFLTKYFPTFTRF
ncbi:MAG: hypothetical protein LH649_09730, partial [Pseudanabaena sp. CAN_BIN31]|nr:hypothetical protein [Pseudanabaena sp. CAN_BIN31]